MNYEAATTTVTDSFMSRRTSWPKDQFIFPKRANKHALAYSTLIPVQVMNCLERIIQDHTTLLIHKPYGDIIQWDPTNEDLHAIDWETFKYEKQ